MSAIKTYTKPRFVGGQKLTATDLNHIVELIEPQSQQTRRGLIGVGISCGLEVRQVGNLLKLGKGAAVTSDGCLFFVENDLELKLVKKDFINLATLKPSLAGAAVPPNPMEIPYWEFAPNDNVTVQVAVNPPTDPVYLLVKSFPTGSADTSPCNDLEPNGINTTFEVCVYAIEKGNLPPLWLCADGGPDDGSLAPVFPCVKRLKPIGEDFINGYFDLCNEALASLAPAIKKALGEAAGAAFITTLEGKITEVFNNFEHQAQYLWAYLKDLVAAFEEWEMACTEATNPTSGCTDEALFPHFVVLGDTLGNCRMDWYPVHQVLSVCDREKIEKRDFLLERLKHLAQLNNLLFGLGLPGYDVSAGDHETLKVTGSAPKHLPLSQMAIPYYYNGVQALRQKWNYELTKCNRWKAIPSYDRDPDIGQQLECDLEKFGFFRVEGHVGHAVSNVFNSLTNLRNDLNLPFKVLVVKHLAGNGCAIPNTPQASSTHPLSLEVFSQIRPGLEHQGGVPAGGTFVLVASLPNPSNQNCLVLGDFCLPYSHEERPAAMFHEKERVNNNDGFTLTFANDSLLSERYLWEAWSYTSAGGLLPLNSELLNLPTDFQLDTPSEVKKVRVRLTTWLDMWDDHFTLDVDLKEKDEHPPRALFHERARKYTVDEDGRALVFLQFDNDSVHADSFKWTAAPADLVTETSDPASPDSFEVFALPVANGTLTIVLSAMRQGLSDDFIQEIDLCPKEMQLVIRDPNPQNEAEVWLEEVVITKQMEVEFLDIKYCPMGSRPELVAPFHLFADLVEITPENAKIKLDLGALAGLDNTTTFTISLTYPCDCYERQARVTFKVDQQFRPPVAEDRDEDAVLVTNFPRPVGVQPIPADGRLDVIASIPREAKAPPISLASNLNGRRNQYRLNVETLAENDRKLAGTKSYKATHHFITTPPMAFGDWHKPFDELSKLLLNSATKPGGVGDEKYLSLLRNASWRYLDGCVGTGGADLPAELRATFKAIVPHLKKAGASMPVFLEAWQPDDLQNEENIALIDALKAMFK